MRETETYLYRDRQTGELVGVEMCLGEKLERERTGGFIDLPNGHEGVRAFEEELAKSGMQPRNRSRRKTKAKWPMTSVNAGVNPNQIGELRQFWTEHGITGCDVNSEGDVIWESPGARKRDCEARGLYDRNAGYSDPQPYNL